MDRPRMPDLETAEARILWAELRDDEELLEELVAQEPGGDTRFDVAPMACYLLARRRFGNARDLREVTHFINWYNTLAPEADRVVVRQAEAVLRIAMGEAYLATALDADVARDLTYRMLLALVDEMKLSDQEIGAVLLSAEEEIRKAIAAGYPELVDDGAEPLSLPLSGGPWYWRPGRTN